MDKQEFARRVTQMQGSLYRVAASYLRGESDRLDAVAEAIARAWEKRGTLRDEALFSTWMTRILIRVCVDIQRRQKRMTPVDTLPETPTGEDCCTALREAVDSLPQKLRTMVSCITWKAMKCRKSPESWGRRRVRSAPDFPVRGRNCARCWGRKNDEKRTMAGSLYA